MLTIHEAKSADTGKRKRDGTDVLKLIIVNDYNNYMGGVDRNDVMLGNYSSVRKSLKWTSKVSYHFSYKYHISYNSITYLHSIDIDMKSTPTKRFVICWKSGKRKESKYECKNCYNHLDLCPVLKHFILHSKTCIRRQNLICILFSY